MSAQRTTTRETYEALLELGSWEEAEPTAYVLFKRTFAIRDGLCHLSAPIPLRHDFRDASQTPRLKPGTDFWPFKEATDLVVRGAAYAPQGRPVDRRNVAVTLGRCSKRIAVFGRRSITWTRDGGPRIDAPALFDRIPIMYENAYGGIDERVLPMGDVALPQLAMAALRIDRPGLYPRNPFGRGYLVDPSPVADLEMPNLEDPDDLLTAERLIVGDPRRWYLQPLPACFDWMHPMMFPRFLWFGAQADPWFPAPDDEELPEVRRGLLVPGHLASRPRNVTPGFYQEAPLGFALRDVKGDEEVTVEGMHPEHDVLRFHLPGGPPSVTFLIEGQREFAKVRTHSIVVEPDAGVVSIVYGATTRLPRMFIPGIHKFIPIAVSIGGDRFIEYDAPPTLREQLVTSVKR